MAKQKDIQPSVTKKLDPNFFSELVAGTPAKLAIDGSLMGARGRVPTPLTVINLIYGGGLPLAMIGEVSGPPGSGKSTFAYQSAAKFQKENPDSIIIVYDTESSMDMGRLESLGLDTSKVIRFGATTLEKTFSEMFKVLDKIDIITKENPKIAVFQIYDTISMGGTDKQEEASHTTGDIINSGGMQQNARVLKTLLGQLSPRCETLNICTCLLNQVATKFSGILTSVESGGGFGLKHACQFHLAFGNPKHNYSEKTATSGKFIVSTEGTLKLNKSKLSPVFLDIPYYIDASRGDGIDEVKSFCMYLPNLGLIDNKVGFINITPAIDFIIENYPKCDKTYLNSIKEKNRRREAFYDEVKADNDLYLLLQICVLDNINLKYSMQIKTNGKYRDKLISECKYLNCKGDVVSD